MLGDVEEGGGRPEEVAVVVLAPAHHHPRIVEEGVVLLAAHPRLVVGVAAAPGFLLGLLLDGAYLDGLLSFLYRAVEIALRLGRLGVGFGRRRMDEHQAGVVVGIFALHLVERLLVVGVAVEMDVVARDEGGIFAREGRVLFQRARAEQGSGGYSRHRQQDHPYAPIASQIFPII